MPTSPRVVVTASPVHDPNSGGGNVGAAATLGGLEGLAAGAGKLGCKFGLGGGSYPPWFCFPRPRVVTQKTERPLES